MKLRQLTLGTLLAGAVILVSCTNADPVSPPQSAAPAFDLLSTVSRTVERTVERTGLLTCSAMPSARVTQSIGPSGGVMNIGAHTFTVPAGALTRTVTITATAPSGSVNHIDFQPEGLQFKRPATLEMSYANCNTLGSLLPKHIAYTTDNLRIIELLESVDNLLAKKVTTRLEHFSDYVMAW